MMAAPDQRIIDGIRAFWQEREEQPTNIIDQIKEDSPWAVLYASPGTFPDAKSVNIEFNKQIIIPKQGEPFVNTHNWQEEDGILSDGSVKWHVLICDVQTFAFYRYDTEGIKGPPLAAVATALGPPGGIPDEAKTTALVAKKAFQNLGIRMNVKYEIFC